MKTWQRQAADQSELTILVTCMQVPYHIISYHIKNLLVPPLRNKRPWVHYIWNRAVLYSVQETCTRKILYKKPCQTVKFLVYKSTCTSFLYKFLDCVSLPLTWLDVCCIDIHKAVLAVDAWRLIQIGLVSMTAVSTCSDNRLQIVSPAKLCRFLADRTG